MRRNNMYGGGRGGGQRSRGGRRGGGGGGRDGGGRGRPRNGRGRRGHPRQSAESGNKRERIAVESGFLVFIDQFMLANPQFIEKLSKTIDGDPELKDQLIREYGGSVIQLQPGTYRIERDPYAYSIVVHPDGAAPEAEALNKDACESRGRLFIDTRCVAMIDRELLDDGGLLEKYQQLWFGGQDKACRDLIRDNGGAVRYGFRRSGDELGIYKLPEQDVICLWPDVIEEAVGSPEASEIHAAE